MSQPYCAVPTGDQKAGTISILIPSYGHAHYIQQTLESLFQQTRQPLEIIVINDGSPDDTTSAVQPYLNRIKYIEQPNQGLIKTLNRGMALCRGDYILVIASDDWLAPKALEKLGVALDMYPDVGLAHGDITIVDMAGQPYINSRVATCPLGKHREVTRLITANYVAAPTVLVRRSAYIDAGPYLDFTYSQDWAMWLTIALQGWAFYGVEEAIAFYRRHPNNLTRPETLLDALEDNLRMLERLENRFASKLSFEYKKSFATARLRITRVIAWHNLAHGRPKAARRCFQALIKESGDRNSILGYTLASVPFGVYTTLRLMRQRLQSLHAH